MFKIMKQRNKKKLLKRFQGDGKLRRESKKNNNSRILLISLCVHLSLCLSVNEQRPVQGKRLLLFLL